MGEYFSLARAIAVFTYSAYKIQYFVNNYVVSFSKKMRTTFVYIRKVTNYSWHDIFNFHL